jgi:hypothetical protein
MPGEQVTAGLDPNFIINAWGRPTYSDAMAAHYLDLPVLMGAAAWMLHLILLPDRESGYIPCRAQPRLPVRGEAGAVRPVMR